MSMGTYVLERWGEATDPTFIEGVPGVFVVPLPSQHIQRDEHGLPDPDAPEYELTLIDVSEVQTGVVLRELEAAGWIAWPSGEKLEDLR